MRLLSTLVALVLAASVVNAEDLVEVTFGSQPTLPKSSTFGARMEVSRSKGVGWSAQEFQSTETFFLEVRKLLDSAKTPASWGAPPLHSPAIRVAVTLGERKHVMYAGFGEKGAQLWLNPTKQDQTQFEVLKEIVRLTVQQSEALSRGMR
jgi:hypothetical protein